MKSKKKVLYPFASMVIATGMLISSSPIHIVKAVDYELEQGKIDPYQNKDTLFLADMEQEGLNFLNQIRRNIGLEPLSIDPILSYSAQSHSNYLVHTRQPSHLQTNSGSDFFTGTYPDSRATYYGYPNNQVGEIISFQTNSTGNAIKKLLDAPYHRVGMLNPNFNEVGIGFNDTEDDFNPTVVNFADEDGEQNIEGPILYPYNNQTDVNTSWYANESPNPLRFWNLNNTYVGYPISISYYGDNRGKLVANNVSLTDENGQDIQFYLVDGAKDGTLSSIFIIPKQPLSKGMTYTAHVEADNYSKYSEITPVTKTWSFTTAADYELRDIDVLVAGGNTKVIKPYFKSGDTNTHSFEVRQNGDLYQTYNEKGNNGYLGYRNITEGIYDIRIKFNDSDQIISQSIKIEGNTVSFVTNSEPVEEPKEEEPIENEELPEDTNPYDDDNNINGSPLWTYELVEKREIAENQQLTSFTFPFNIKGESVGPDTVFMLDKDGNKQPIIVILDKDTLKIAFDDMEIEAGQTYELYFDWNFLLGTENEQLEKPQKYILDIIEAPKEETEENEEEPVGNEQEEAPDNQDNEKNQEEVEESEKEEFEIQPTPLSDYGLIKEYEINATANGIRLPFTVALDSETIHEQSVFLLDKYGNRQSIRTELSQDNMKLSIYFDNMKLEEGMDYTLYFDNAFLKGVQGNELPQASKIIIHVLEAENTPPEEETPSEEENPSEENEQPSNEQDTPPSEDETPNEPTPSDDEDTPVNKPDNPSDEEEEEDETPVKDENDKESENDNMDLSRYVLVKEYNISTTSNGFRFPFTVPIKESSITEANIFFLDQNGNKVNAEIKLKDDKKTLKVRFAKDVQLQEGQQLTLYIDNTIEGVNGNKLPQPSKVILNVQKPSTNDSNEGEGNTSPKDESNTNRPSDDVQNDEKEDDIPSNDLPKNHEEYKEKFKPINNVTETQKFSLNFTGSIDMNSVNTDTIILLDEENKKVEITIETSPNGRVVVSPVNQYQKGKSYTLYISNDIKGKNGLNLKEAVKFTFTVR